MFSPLAPTAMPASAAPAPAAAVSTPAAQGISDASAASRQQMANAVLAAAQATAYNPNAAAPASMPVTLGLPFTSYLHAQIFAQSPSAEEGAAGQEEQAEPLAQGTAKKPPSFARAKGAFAYAIAGVRTGAVEREAAKAEAAVHPALAGLEGMVDTPAADGKQVEGE